MDSLLPQLVDRLKRAHGEDLVACILYGSAARPGEHDPGYSDWNVLCVLKEITPLQLERSHGPFSWWRSLDRPAPLLLSSAEVAHSADCFPIEFTDMLAAREILYGADVIADLCIERTFYRMQVEYELRTKLLRLRQKAAAVLSDPKLLGRLLVESVSTFCVLLRHALLLYGETIGWNRREALAAAHRRWNLDTAPFEQLLAVREGKAKLRSLAPQALLGSYLEQIGIVINAVDRLGTPAPVESSSGHKGE